MGREIALVIAVSGGVPEQIIDEVCAVHMKQTVPIDIVIARLHDNVFNLAKARNLGASKTMAKWLVFSDVDIVYDNNVFAKMLELGCDVVAGRSRVDVESLQSMTPLSEIYTCAFAPLMIRRELFDKVGGYCERYLRWGYEDSDFEHKFTEPLVPFDSRSSHVMSIHNSVSVNDAWRWGSDDNRVLFDERMAMTMEQRIEQDVINRSRP